VTGQPALLVDDGTLAISDLHLGFERALEARGVHVPEQTQLLLDRVKAIGEGNSARRLVILGDVKHDIRGASLYTSMSVASFFRGLEDAFDELYVIPGNHDGGLAPLLPAKVRLAGPGGMALQTTEGRVGFFHGHAHPAASVGRSKVLVTGHHHLILSRQGTRQGIWVRLTFGEAPAVQTLIVMPAFNPLLSGMPASEFTPKKWEPVVERFLKGSYEAEAFLLDGSKLGNLEELADRLLIESD